MDCRAIARSTVMAKSRLYYNYFVLIRVVAMTLFIMNFMEFFFIFSFGILALLGLYIILPYKISINGEEIMFSKLWKKEKIDLKENCNYAIPH
jgi:hypothetical protein